MSRIGAVVVHWRDSAATLACLASLAPEPEIDVPVVDNGSSDPLAVPPGVRCVRSEENRGCAEVVTPPRMADRP